MMLGVNLLYLGSTRRELAQIDQRVMQGLGFPKSYTNVQMQVTLSSTLSRSYVQNRYPSPLERFANCGGPLFLLGRRLSRRADGSRDSFWRHSADRKRSFSAGIGLKRGSLFCDAAFASQTCSFFAKEEGEQLCAKHLYHSPCLSRSAALRPAILMQNAALSAPVPGQQSRPQLGAHRSLVRSLAARRASSVTTSGCVTDQPTIRSKSHESQSALGRSGFFYAQTAPARALNLGTS